jgi:hypothetical protein
MALIYIYGYVQHQIRGPCSLHNDQRFCDWSIQNLRPLLKTYLFAEVMKYAKTLLLHHPDIGGLCYKTFYVFGQLYLISKFLSMISNDTRLPFSLKRTWKRQDLAQKRLIQQWTMYHLKMNINGLQGDPLIEDNGPGSPVKYPYTLLDLLLPLLR